MAAGSEDGRARRASRSTTPSTRAPAAAPAKRTTRTTRTKRTPAGTTGTAEVAAILGRSKLFAGSSATSLRGLAPLFERMHVPGGSVLFSEGDEGDAVYVVVSGRLRAVRRTPGAEVVDGEIGAGETVGEVALLAARPRGSTVRAVRDTDLLRLPVAAFHRAVSARPETLFELARTVVERLSDGTGGAGRAGGAAVSVTNVAVVPAASTAPGELTRVAALVAGGLGRLGSTAHLDPAAMAWTSVASDAEVVAHLHAVEAANRFVVYEAGDDGWTARCLRQADHVLVVGVGGRAPSVGPAEHAADAHGRRDLVLLHDDSTALPSGTAAWLEPRAVAAHHHVRWGRTADHDRLARTIAGEAVSLVLGGGGPRGFAHLGVMRALDDLGVPVDAVGGTSIGALLGAMLAMGWDDDTRIERCERTFMRTRLLIPPTLPLVSLSSSRRLTRLLRDAACCGDVRIEDLWLPYFAVSANLSTAEEVVHDSGPLWLAVRASTSMPGVLPPVCVDGDLLVDGGVVNDLPVDVMHERLRGTVVAVDLQPDVDLRAPEAFDPTLSGWEVLARRLHPFRAPLKVPGPVEVVMRAKEIGGRRARRATVAASPVDVLLRPPTDGVDALDFRGAGGLLDDGHRSATAELRGSALAARFAKSTAPAETNGVVSSATSATLGRETGGTGGSRPRRSLGVPRRRLPIAPAFVAMAGLRDLRWRRRRFAIAVAGTSLVFALTLLLSGFLEGFTVEARNTLDAFGADQFVVKEGAAGPFTVLAPIPDTTADVIATVPGVRRADPVVTVRHTIDQTPPLDVFVVGARPGGLGMPPPKDGRQPIGPGEAMVDASTGLALGDEFGMGPGRFRVVGRTTGLSIGGGLPDVFLTIDTVQALVLQDLPVATSILVAGDPTGAMPDGLTVVDRAGAEADLFRPLVDVIESIELFRLLLWIVAGAIIGSVLYLSALERTRDFAVFKATGTTTADLVGAMALQAVLLAVGSAVVAIGVAHLLAPAFPAEVSFPLRLLLLTPAVAVGVGTLSSVFGIRRAVAADPALAFGSGA